MNPMNFHHQRGGTLAGFILGLVIGLGVALGVAIYVTKVPTPFASKNPSRNADQDNTESQKNKDWNPNGVLQPKAPAEVPGKAAGDKVGGAGGDKPVADITTESVRSDAGKAEPRLPAVNADPLGDLAKSKNGLSTAPDKAATNDPFDYVIQAGAYRNAPDADAQKARLALIGLDAKVSERDQAGRAVFRVRIGPYSDKAAAERVRARLESSGIENTLVRVQR